VSSVLIALLLAALLPFGGTIAAAPTIVDVTPDNLQGWELQNYDCVKLDQGTGTIAFVNGPATPPLGTGSLRLAIGTEGGSFAALYNGNVQFRLALSAIQALTYDSYISAGNIAAGQAPFLIIDVDTTGDGVADDQLYFEPGRQDGTYPVDPGDGPIPTQGPPALNTWQEWNAKTGGWRSRNDGLVNPPQHTLTGYATDHPGATITNSGTGAFGFRIGAGCGSGAWAGFIGHVDDLTLGVGGNATRFNFETGSTPSPSPSPAAYTLTATAQGSGTVAGGGSYNAGDVAAVTATAGAGQLLTGWTFDGQFVGWHTPLSITMNSSHTVVGTFAPTKTFGDVPSNHQAANAITQLATRGYIRGYNATQYGPNDGVQRAQMAALIARAMPHGPGTPPTMLTPPACLVAGSWDCEDWGNTFTDRQGLDANLWRNAGTLQHYNVARGYAAGDCAAKGKAFPCYGPTDPVTHAETITFITRAMVAKGYWTLQPATPQPGVPTVFAAEFATYIHYTGGLPAAPANWNGQASRGWFAMALWQALNSYWGVDRVP
jgi:hypothetical protein